METAELNRALKAEEVLARELSEYAGSWVAIQNRSVIASASSLEELLDRVDPEGLDRILEVSEQPVAGCFY
jgi:Family of unknown function (DUF5678)